MKASLVIIFGLIALQALCSGKERHGEATKKKGQVLGPWLKANKKNVQKYISNKAGKPTNVSQAILGGDSVGCPVPFFMVLQTSVKVCGGTLIHKDYVVTTASCLINYAYDDQSEVEYIFTIWQSEFWTHPNYNEDTFENDIALVLLFQDYDYGASQISPISIWPADNTMDLTGYFADFVGIGSEDAVNMVLPIGIVSKTQEIKPMSYCTGKTEFSALTESTHYCTVSAGEASGACWQDEGGPLYVYDSDEVPILIGIVGMQPFMCPATDYPSQHTRLTNYLCWLEETSDNALSLTPAGFCPVPGGSSCDAKRKLAQSNYKIRNLNRQKKEKAKKHRQEKKEQMKKQKAQKVKKTNKLGESVKPQKKVKPTNSQKKTKLKNSLKKPKSTQEETR